MKKIFLLIFVLLCVIFFAIPALAEMKNEPDGFRGIPWGTPAPQNYSKVKNKWGIVKLIKAFSVTMYYREKESALMGGAIVTSIKYEFQESLGFAAVNIDFEGRENCELLRKACINSWGKPDHDEKDLTETYDGRSLSWYGERVTILLFYDNEEPCSGALMIYLKNYPTVRKKGDAKHFQRMEGF